MFGSNSTKKRPFFYQFNIITNIEVVGGLIFVYDFHAD